MANVGSLSLGVNVLGPIGVDDEFFDLAKNLSAYTIVSSDGV